MKYLSIFLVSFIIGLIVGAYVTYAFLVDVSMENAGNLLEESMNDVYTGKYADQVGNILEARKKAFIEEFNNKIDEYKNDMKARIMEVIKNRLNELF